MPETRVPETPDERAQRGRARRRVAARARRNQLVLFSAIAAAVLMVFAFWLAAGGSNPPRPEARIDAELATPGTAEESWTRRSEARLGAMDARLRDMEAEARGVKQENERLRQKLAADAEDAKRTIDGLAAKIEEMERGRAGGETGAADASVPAADPFRAVPAESPASGAESSGGAAPAPLIETFPLDDAAAPFGAPAARDIDAWLPAGSNAEAVVLAGVDASAGISSQGDPRPVLLRIVGPAWTAAEGTRADDGTALAVDIDGCTVTGAAHGDLSSEKVYARLRTLTCAGEEPGTVLETQVAGFVAGAGKTGVRGPVVSREGALVEKAFLAGLVSGLGEGVSSAFAPQAVATGTGAAVANTGLDDIGRAGLGSGASSAGRKVADYLIRRAEQYQPVIQLQAGTPGDGGVHRGRLARRQDGDEGEVPMKERNGWAAGTATAALAALALAGCSGTHVGEDWQCPLAQGEVCSSVAAADPAVPETRGAEPFAAATPLYRPGARSAAPATETSAGRDPDCDRGCGPLAWLAELFAGNAGAAEDDAEGAAVSGRGGDDGTATSEPASGKSAAPPVAPPAQAGDADRAAMQAGDASADGFAAVADDGRSSEPLRAPEEIARIWIAPYVDAEGIYREGAWVRAVIAPAEWRLP